MANKLFRQPVKTLTYAADAVAGTVGGVQQFSDGFVSGDLLMRCLRIRISGTQTITSSSAGTPNPVGPLQFLRAITIKTDKHNNLVDNVDGLGLYRIAQFMKGGNTVPELTPIASASTGTPTFAATIEIPFYAPGMAKGMGGGVDFGDESRLDMSRARLTGLITGGAATDIQPDGTNSANSTAASVEVSQFAEYPVSGKVALAHKPNSILSIELIKVDITATKTGWTYDLPYGDRIYRYVAISQRNSSTLAEIATVITKAAMVGLTVNNVPFINDISAGQLMAENKEDFGLTTMPTGWIVLDMMKSGKKSEGLNTISTAQGKLTLKADVTSVTNGALWLYLVSFKDIPEPAVRPDAEYAAA